ncbi:MAG TPA: hypothetical protein VE594_05025 [Nitrososphaeraceae archaeon]|nr:hypothetical protein [Nitrososphaeraceae archaeon]
MATVVILTRTLPFRISFIVSQLAIISFNMIRADIALKKGWCGRNKGFGINKSYSLLPSGRRCGRNVNSSLYKSRRYLCMSCCNEHNKVEFPKSGSKAVRAG